MTEVTRRKCLKCGEQVLSTEGRCCGCRAKRVRDRLEELGWEDGVVYVDGLPVGRKAYVAGKL